MAQLIQKIKKRKMEKEQIICKNKLKTFKFTEKNHREKKAIS